MEDISELFAVAGGGQGNNQSRKENQHEKLKVSFAHALYYH
jgi:hypothetical protein